MADAFGSVIRVSSVDRDACDHVALPSRSRLTRPEREAGLRVATAAMVSEPDELEWEVEERSGVRFYRIHPADGGRIVARVEKVIAAWDEQDVVIGVAPELCLSRALLERWQVALREREGAGASRLRLVVAGSGNVDASSPPVNEAVMLDARTGEVLVRQRKVHPFNFLEQDLELWGLADRLTAPIDEDLSRGERVCVVEAGGARLAILVCEDLARLHAFASALHAHGVSLLLVPVFARPTKDRRWERARAEVYSDAIGSSVVVANSLVIAQILRSPKPVGTAIAVAPVAPRWATPPSRTTLWCLSSRTTVRAWRTSGSVCRANARVELAGLEPATSWVRSRAAMEARNGALGSSKRNPPNWLVARPARPARSTGGDQRNSQTWPSRALDTTGWARCSLEESPHVGLPGAGPP